MMDHWKIITLSVVSFVFLFAGLGDIPLIDWDEAIYAEASRQMVVRDDYLNVHINGHPFAEKPPLFFWLQSLSYHLFGINEFAARAPSAFVGMLAVMTCFVMGVWVQSTRFGLVWAIVYLSSLLPAVLSRSAVIDYTFNWLIMVASFSLYAYDVCYRNCIFPGNLNHTGSIRRIPFVNAPVASVGTTIPGLPWYHFGFLTLASVAMGLAVLTKGPVGGVIPLVSYGCYKLVYRTPRISLMHFIYCGILSLSIGCAWYIANWWIYGQQFIENFIGFQKALLTKPLEGHQGPFVYHWVIAIFGLFPWTPFLLGMRKSIFPEEHDHLRPLFFSSIGWILFVLTLFSIVTTKLPHYSASVYIPLSFLVSCVITHYLRHTEALPKKVIFGYLGLGLLVSAVLLALPMGLTQHLEQAQIAHDAWSWTAYLAGSVLLISVLIASYFFFKQKLLYGFVVTAVGSLLLLQSMWRYQVPLYLNYIQTPVIELVDEAHDRGAKVVFYRFVSFTALFYGQQTIEMLHTYKFPGNPDILNASQDREHWVIAEKKQKKRLEKKYPLLVFIKNHGNFSLFILPKREVAPL